MLANAEIATSKGSLAGSSVLPCCATKGAKHGQIEAALLAAARLRASFSLIRHRSECYARAEAQHSAALYYEALQAIRPGALSVNLCAELVRMHGMLTGVSAPAPFRQSGAAVRSASKTSRLYLIPIPASSIVAALRDLSESIYRHDGLSPVERIALTYLEILRIHPFEDGNGRLARLFLSTASVELMAAAPPLDITRVMRGNMRTYNCLLRRERSAEAYGEWIRFFGGLLQTERHLWLRLGHSFSQMTIDEQVMCHGVVSELLQTVSLEQDVGCVLATLTPAMSARLHNFFRALLS